MDKEPSNVNLWVRADIERPDPETKLLVIADEQPEYDAVLAEVEAAGIALNALLGLIPAAQERMSEARAAQLAFFHKQRTGGII